jgi:hypothetical protein
VHVAAASISSTAAAAPERAAISTPAVDAASASSRRTVVLITGRDATTGAQINVQCVTDSDRVATDALLAELQDLGDVASRVCMFGADSVWSS